MKKNGFEDKRLLEAVDHIDKKYISEALGYYDNIEKSVPKRRVGYILSLAACLALLVAAVPLITYLIPRIGVIFGGTAGAGSSDMLSENEENVGEITYSSRDEDMSDRDLIEHVGEVPKEFVDIINKNLFADIQISGGKVIKYADPPYNIEVYDLSGKLLHRIDVQIDEPEFWYYEHKVHSLSDGTYLFFVPYQVTYSSQGENIINDRVVRFDKNGKVIFDIDLDVKASGFEFFAETDDAYILADGSYQRRYCHFIKIDKSGKITKKIEMGGDEYDRLYDVEYVNGTLYALMRNQRLTHKPYETVTVRFDSDLNVIGYSDEEDFPEIKRDAYTFGYMNVSEFFESRFPDKVFEEAEGTIALRHLATAVIEYDDFILLVSEHDTKHYYPLLLMSTPFSFTETVYTAYSFDGNILWRTAVDSTDYEYLARLEAEKEKYDKFAEEYRKKQSTAE
ncbi:MAG: hypothetical protein J6S71_07120 [Clostridia bacterium]|nr:hypothetical protein [Clostridia bacterium]